MSRYFSYLNSAVAILEKYKGEQPFAIYIKQFFAGNKKFGSKDRREISELCYNYFRLGFAAQQYPTAQQIMIAAFLCRNESTELLLLLNKDLNDQITLPVKTKLQFIQNEFPLNAIFPFTNELSDEVNKEAFTNSFLQQPALFLRIRPGQQKTTEDKLKIAGIPYTFVNDDCIQLATNTKVAVLLDVDVDIVIQDYNSQRVLDYIKQHVQNILMEVPAPLIWDCCAASGGKSILIYDIFYKNIQLTVSDIRSSILNNLKNRFYTAGIKKYQAFTADIMSGNFTPPQENYDIILCDAPCTGSGTWSRTPEQLYFFKLSTINLFAEKQKNIIKNIIPYLKKNGLLVYITCSVFKKENEDAVSFVLENTKLKLLHQALLTGYNEKADSMFVAIFKA